MQCSGLFPMFWLRANGKAHCTLKTHANTPNNLTYKQKPLSIWRRTALWKRMQTPQIILHTNKSLCLSAYLSARLSVCLCCLAYLSDCLSVCLPVSTPYPLTRWTWCDDCFGTKDLSLWRVYLLSLGEPTAIATLPPSVLTDESAFRWAAVYPSLRCQ